MRPMAMMTVQRVVLMIVTLLAVNGCGGGDQKSGANEFAQEWRKVETLNFTVYTPWDTPRPLRGIEKFGEACDNAYGFIAGQLSIEVDGDISVYLFTTSADCEKSTGRPASYVDKLNIYTRLGAPVGGLIAEAMCNSIDPEAKSFTLIRDGVRNLFDERDINVHYRAAELRQSKAWPRLEDLLKQQPVSDPEVYKFASASLVAFLIQRYGIEQFRMLWRSVLDLSPSIERIYGGTLTDIEAEWLRVQEKLAKRT